MTLAHILERVKQNLVLLDEAPVYNSSHLLGFLSVFNPDAVKDLKLYKGGIPSRYGGRISSILDIRMKDGNNKNKSVMILTKGIEFTLEWDEEVPEWITIDKQKLKQVLDNLLGNALKFTEKGSIKVDVNSYFFGTTKKTVDLIFNIEDF